MEKRKIIFVFRRDLRLEDNTALFEASKKNFEIIPIFVFDERQIKNNEYRSEKAFSFMIDSLKELENKINQLGGKMNFLMGNPSLEIAKLAKKENVEEIFLNRDYTPFSKKRDLEIESSLKKIGASLRAFDDVTINPLGKIKNLAKKPYTIFTPYYKKASREKILRPLKNPKFIFSKNLIEQSLNIKDVTVKEKGFIQGGRKNALEIIRSINQFKEYSKERNIPCLEKTTHLSAYLKFGCISARELYWSIIENLGENHPLIKQLYWRDFYYEIANEFPNVFQGPFKVEYSKLRWNNAENKINAWKNGITGFPIVDAGIRQLNKTGFMHNRVRMIVASFLIKDLNVDWRIGEKYFAQKLIDYDPCVNNGNWQWVASTGCDSQPYFRIFNPWTQQKKFDPDCSYIKKWIPQLSTLSSKEIHNLENNFPIHLYEKYPKKIIEHKIESKKSKELYLQTKKKFLQSHSF